MRPGGRAQMETIGWMSANGYRRADRVKDQPPTMLHVEEYRAGWCAEQERDRSLRAWRTKMERQRSAADERAMLDLWRQWRATIETPGAEWQRLQEEAEKALPRPRGRPRLPDSEVSEEALRLRRKRDAKANRPRFNWDELAQEVRELCRQ